MELTADFFQRASKVFTVSEADPPDSRHTRDTIRRGLGPGGDLKLQIASRGHQYFTLKDARGPDLLRHLARHHDRRRAEAITDGAKVQVYGNVSVFEARGQYQLSVQILQTDRSRPSSGEVRSA